MRFMCEVCPTTASESQTVIIGEYEKWIRHLLSPQHQTEQNLVMLRTSYWPTAKWIALIKNLPECDLSTIETYVDVLMTLSEYGFVEAIYYGNKTADSLCVAIQLHLGTTVPSFFTGPDGTRYEVKVAPRVDPNFPNGLNAGKIVRRRFRYNASSDKLPLPEGPKKQMRDSATSPIASPALNFIASKIQELSIVDAKANAVTGQNRKEFKKNRITYDRDTLLQLRNQKYMPRRFSKIIQFPKYLIEQEAKTIDLQALQELQRINLALDTNANYNKSGYRQDFRSAEGGFRGYNGSGDGVNGYNSFQRNQRSRPPLQNGWNSNSQWKDNKPDPKIKEGEDDKQW